MIAPFDLSQSELLSNEKKPAWRSLIERMGDLAERVACRHDAVLIDFRAHPAGADADIYSTDRIHLNARGHAICATQTLHELERRVGNDGPSDLKNGLRDRREEMTRSVTFLDLA
jgi:hypothetical protein